MSEAKPYDILKLTLLEKERLEKELERATNTREGRRDVSLDIVAAAEIRYVDLTLGTCRSVYVACRNLSRKSSYILVDFRHIRDHGTGDWCLAKVVLVATFRAKRDLIRMLSPNYPLSYYGKGCLSARDKQACVCIAEQLLPKHTIAALMLSHASEV